MIPQGEPGLIYPTGRAPTFVSVACFVHAARKVASLYSREAPLVQKAVQNSSLRKEGAP